MREICDKSRKIKNKKLLNAVMEENEQRKNTRIYYGNKYG